MDYDLVGQVIAYLPAIMKYVATLQMYLDAESQDALDRDYIAFFKDFQKFVQQEYENRGPLYRLEKDYGELRIPLEDSILYYCLHGIKDGLDAIAYYRKGCMSERMRIYAGLLKERFGLSLEAELSRLSLPQWRVLELEWQNANDWESLFASLHEVSDD